MAEFLIIINFVLDISLLYRCNMVIMDTKFNSRCFKYIYIYISSTLEKEFLVNLRKRAIFDVHRSCAALYEGEVFNEANPIQRLLALNARPIGIAIFFQKLYIFFN